MLKKNEKLVAPFDTNFQWNKNLDKVRVELSKVSPTYCLAKWAHSTIHFHLGMTHSCYNLPLHQIPTEELAKNPSSLHNTPIKIEQRRLMLDGARPAGCAYCWNIEDLKNDNMSDRIIQSAGDWAYPAANDIYNSGLGEQINPRYLEVSFSNICNFKCSYCSPLNSTAWGEEIKRYGPYVVGFNQAQPNILDEENNPYIETFNEWWPSLKKDLKVFRITGGEPLLSKKTWQILEDLGEHPLPGLHLCINSNLGVSDKIIDKMIAQLKILFSKKSIARFTLFTSIEATGEHAEYIRYGLNSKSFFYNIEKILHELPEIRISIMATFCALSIFSYIDLVKKVISLRQRCSGDNPTTRLGLATNYLRFPEYLSVHILPQSYLQYMEEIYKYMKRNEFHIDNYKIGFTQQEISMFDNVKQWMTDSVAEDKQLRLRQEFLLFFKEHDRRRAANLFHTFPLLQSIFSDSAF